MRRRRCPLITSAAAVALTAVVAPVGPPAFQVGCSTVSRKDAEPGGGRHANAALLDRGALGRWPRKRFTATAGCRRTAQDLQWPLWRSRKQSDSLVALAATPTPSLGKQASWKQGSSVVVYIVLWYFFAVNYNIDFKKALIAFPFPWTHALWQISFGWFIFGPLWLLGVRKVPKLAQREIITLIPAALGNLVLHVGAIIAFFGGAVSFVHIVKASEPVVSSVLNYLCIGEVLPWPVYMSLIPIIGGVSLASAKELSFTWLGFGAAMASNVGAAGRAVYSKKCMGSSLGQNMTPENTFSVLTILGMLMLIPLALLAESPRVAYAAFHQALEKGGKTFLLHMFSSAFCYYMYNELAFLALGKLDPVSHAVVNTMRRVVIIMAAIVVFNTKISLLGGIGSGVAILGTLLYSLAKTKFKK